MSMDEKDLKKLAEEQSENIKIPDSLQPDQIQQMLESRGQKKRKYYYGKITAAAACGLLVIGAVAAGTVGFGFGTGTKSDHAEFQMIADADSGAAAGSEEMLTESAADSAADSSGGSESGVAGEQDGAAGGQNGKESSVSGRSDRSGDPFEVTDIKTAKNYDEVFEYIEAENKRMQEMQRSTEEYAVMDDVDGGMAGGSAKMESAPTENEVSADTAGEAGGASGYSDTNVREEGVGEADIVKTDGKRLYIVNNQQIQIVGIEKEEMERLSTIRLDQECYVSEIFVKGDRLIAVYSQSEYRDQGDVSTGEYGGRYLQYAVAETFDISKPEKPKSVGKISQSGNYNTMRVSGDYVYLLSDFYAEIYSSRTDRDGYIPMVQGKRIESGDILMPMGARAEKYTIISAFSIKDPEKRWIPRRYSEARECAM